MSKTESGRELECGGFVVWWSLFLRKQHKRLELCCPPSNISCFHMAEFCIRVAYVSVRVRFALFFFLSVFCILWLILCFLSLWGDRRLFWTRLCRDVKQILHFLMAFWRVCQQVCSLCLVFRIDFEDRFIFLNLLTCECRSKAEFSWITQF